MRTKNEILDDSLEAQRKEPTWDTAMSKHEQLTIEVWLDIRDELTTMKTFLGAVLKKIYSED